MTEVFSAIIDRASKDEVMDMLAEYYTAEGYRIELAAVGWQEECVDGGIVLHATAYRIKVIWSGGKK